MPMRRRMTVEVDAPGGDLLAFDDDAAGLDRFEQVHAAKQRRLARARGPDEADDLVLGDDQVDALEHLEVAEGLVQPLDPQRLPAQRAAAGAEGRDRHRAPAIWRVRSRATSQSTKRDMGMVRARKMTAAMRYGVKLNSAALDDLGPPEGFDQRRGRPPARCP